MSRSLMWCSVVDISCKTSAGPAAGWWRPCTRRGCRRAGSPCAAGGPASRGHEDAGQGRVAVELDPEHVPRLALVPVVGRVDRDDGRDVRVTVGAGHLDTDP